MRPHKGMFFRHSRWLDPDYSGRPLTCKITAIRLGIVYWRPFYGHHPDGSEWLGSTMYVKLEDFYRFVEEELCR